LSLLHYHRVSSGFIVIDGAFALFTYHAPNNIHHVYSTKKKGIKMVWRYYRGRYWSIYRRSCNVWMEECVAITLLRHGMTKENERKAYIVWTDSPLSEKGKEALRLIDHSFQPDVTFSSPLLRCTETAEILFPHQEIHCVPDMKEMNF